MHRDRTHVYTVHPHIESMRTMPVEVELGGRLERAELHLKWTEKRSCTARNLRARGSREL